MSLKGLKKSALLKVLKKEQTKRALENSLIDFARYKFACDGQNFIVSEHHEMIADALDRVEKGEIKNLVITICPRYGKTELAVISWISKCLAKNPKAKFIHLSYSDELALDNSSKIKEFIESDAYQEFWPTKLKADAKSKKKWYTEKGGGVYATKASGAVTGFGAGSTEETNVFSGAIVIDDPIKVGDAESELERRKVNERLNNTIKSRRNNVRQTPIIIIMQRLHEDDMAGFVLKGGMGEKFHHLNLPAIKEDGTPLWPYKHTIEELETERKADPRTFASQMMQNPTPDDGDFFKREWFKRYEVGEEPELFKYGASDYAVTDGGGDYTEHGVCGFDEKNNMYICDWWSGQKPPDVWITEQLELVKRHDPMVWVAEGGSIRRSIEPFLKREMNASNAYVRTEWITSNQNKAANARGFQALASQGKVYIPLTPWGEDLISQLLKFPNGKFDDKVDVCGLFGRILDQTYSPDVLKGEVKIKDPYLDEFEEDWMTL